MPDEASDGFSFLSVVDVRGDRWVYPHARVLGIRDGYLFLEEQTGTEIRFSTITKIPLDDMTRLHIETTEHDAADEQSTTFLALTQSGNLDADGNLTPG